MIFQLVIIAVFLGYTLLILTVTIGWWRLKRFTIDDHSTAVKVSLVVALRNEANNVRILMQSLLKQDYPPELLEIIFVNDHSTDETLQILTETQLMADTVNRIKIISLKEKDGFGKKAALDCGIRASSAELIVITDADCTAGVSWISMLASYYMEHKPKMILGPVRMPDKGNLFSKLQSLEFMSLMSTAAGSCRAGFPILANGANIAFTRQAFLDCGGFSDNILFPSGDDMFLMMGVKKKYGAGSVHFLKSVGAIVSTPVSYSFSAFIQQRLRWVSKSSGYTDPVLIAVSILVFLTNSCLILSAFVAFLLPGFFKFFLLLWGFKLLVDFPLMLSYSRFQKTTGIMWLFAFMELLNAVYTLFIGIAGNVVPYEWKGRKSVLATKAQMKR